jgi:hypothetical protein
VAIQNQLRITKIIQNRLKLNGFVIFTTLEFILRCIMESNLPLSEQFRLIAKKWIDADAAANILEETKSAFLAQKMAEQGDVPVSRAEMAVKASQEWAEYVESMVNARKRAALLKAQLEYIRMQFTEQQSIEATRRAEMKL